MKEKNWRLYEAIGEIDDKYLEEALPFEEKPKTRRGTKVRYLRRTLIAAALVICIVSASAVAAVKVLPVMKEVYNDSPVYEQSATSLRQSVTCNGWTLTCTDLLADDYNFYAGFELAAPEGTVLGEPERYNGTEFTSSMLDFSLTHHGFVWGGLYGPHFVEDDDPNDNLLHFIYVFNGTLGDGKGGLDASASILGETASITFKGFAHSEYNEETGEWEEVTDCTGSWSFKIELTDTGTELEVHPNVEVQTLGVTATVSSVRVSPLGVYIYIEGEELRNHHEWVEFSEGDYNCTREQEVILYTKDGTEIPMDYYYNSGCGGGDETDEENPYLFIARKASADRVNGVSWPTDLLDVSELASISICGVNILLNQE